MTKEFWKSAAGWGVGLWAIGYVLGILLFAFVPANLIGWVVMPVGVAITLWVLLKKVKLKNLNEYFWLGVVWVAMAIILDYFLLVKVFKPADGYYKLDVYLYYALTFTLPLLIGFRKK